MQAALRRPLDAARLIWTIAEDACLIQVTDAYRAITRIARDGAAYGRDHSAFKEQPRPQRFGTRSSAFLLVFVTLGIYYLVWYYKINRELRDLGRATGQEERLGRSPFTSLMAITFGWLILVPPFVSMYRTLKRIQAAQEISGTAGEPINVWLGFVLYLVGVFTLPGRDHLRPERAQPPLAHRTAKRQRSCPRPPDENPPLRPRVRRRRPVSISRPNSSQKGTP